MNIMQYLGIGSAHFEKDIPCQDYANSCITFDGKTVLALADGCSSSRYALEGAKVNVETVIKYFNDPEKSSREALLADTEKLKPFLLNAITAELMKKAEELDDCGLRDLSATLVFAVYTKERTLVGHIGDGTALCFGSNAELLYCSEADNGEDAYHTFFTNSDDADLHFSLESVDSAPIKNIMLYSDGPQKMFYTQGEGDIVGNSASLIRQIQNGEITDSTTLANVLHRRSCEAMYQIADDWSLLILDKKQMPSKDAIKKPLVMSYYFYELYFTAHPESRLYAEDRYQKAKAAYLKMNAESQKTPKKRPKKRSGRSK